MNKVKVVFVGLFLSALLSVLSHAEKIVIDTFSSAAEANGIPKGWKTLSFKKIKRHTQYTVMQEEENFFVQAQSQNSASAIYKQVQIIPRDFPILSWKWKIDNIIQKSDPRKKSGDDYPARIYVAFKYNPKDASLWEKIRYGAIKAVYGSYPPKHALNYIWGPSFFNRGITLDNPYTNRTKMIVVESGTEKIGRWVQEERNVYEDYKRFFSSEPPEIEFIAIMTDTDNTGESCTAYYDDITLSDQF
jgi:hypothetical protein